MSAFFASVLLGFLSFLLLVNLFSIRIPKQFALQKSLEEIKEKNPNKKTSNYKDDEFSFLYNNFRYKIFAQRFAGFKLTEKIKNEIMLSGVNMQVDTFIILSVMCVVPIAVILLLTTPKLLPISLLGLFIPLNVLKIKTSMRNAAFAKQLPDTLDLLSNSLRAGHSIYSAFEVITKEMPMPISGVFKTAIDELAVGSDAKQAILSLSKTVPNNMDLKFFITAVILQREVGGNLAKILDGLSYTIRERFKMAGQLKAQTAQARFSGFMLVCVPPIIAGILFVLSPDYMSPLLNTQQGNSALLLALTLLLLGVYMIKKIVTIEI